MFQALPSTSGLFMKAMKSTAASTSSAPAGTAQSNPPSADASTPTSSFTGSRATRQSKSASSAMRGSSHGPEMAMAALPAIMVLVASYWRMVTTSREA